VHGAGPASLAVANDLLPLGYQIVMFEKLERPGGLMRSNIPAFRLPERVLEEEVDVILNMGVDIRYGSPINSMKSLLEEGFDSIFVGSGAPRGKELDLPGRHETTGFTSASTGWNRLPSATSIRWASAC
jgi:NADPH-dependent glutamate synthase beta chain and related oxidoreductases